jgi:hypothetical protein
MALGTIAITQGDGGKVLATSSIVQDSTTVELQRYIPENFASAGPETYAIAAVPTSPTGAGVLLSIENNGGSGLNLYVARIEVQQTSTASSAVAREIRIGRAAANGTAGTSTTPISYDPNAGVSGCTIRTSSAATPDTGITAPTSPNIYETKNIVLGSTTATLSSVAFDFVNPGQLPGVPYDSTTPITVAISGSASTAGLVINVVYLEHGV